MGRLGGLALVLLAGCATAGGGAEPVRVTLELFEFDAGHAGAVDLALAGREASAGLTAFVAPPDFLPAYRAESVRFRSRRTSVQSIRLVDGLEGLLQTVEHASVVADLPVRGGAGVVLTGAGLALRAARRPDGAIDLELTPWCQVLRGPTLRLPERAMRLSAPPGRPVVVLAREPEEAVASALLFARTPRGLRRTVAVLVAE